MLWCNQISYCRWSFVYTLHFCWQTKKKKSSSEQKNGRERERERERGKKNRFLSSFLYRLFFFFFFSFFFVFHYHCLVFSRHARRDRELETSITTFPVYIYIDLFVVWMNFLIEFIFFINLFPFLRSNQSLISWKDMSHIVLSLKPLHPSICQFKVENCHQTFAYAQQYDTYCNFYSRLRDCYRPLFDDMQCLSSELEKTYRTIRQNEYDACNNHPLARSVYYTSSCSSLRMSMSFLIIIFICLIIWQQKTLLSLSLSFFCYPVLLLFFYN